MGQDIRKPWRSAVRSADATRRRFWQWSVVLAVIIAAPAMPAGLEPQDSHGASPVDSSSSTANQGAAPGKNGARGDLKRGFGLTGFPVAFATPETGFGAGAGGILTYRRTSSAAERPQSLPAFAFYTVKRQTLMVLAPELYLDDELWQIQISLAYQKFPDSFYGIGNETPEDAEEDFTTRSFQVRPVFQRRIWDKLRAGVVYEYKRTTVLETEEGGLLRRRAVAGHGGGDISGIGPILNWDTRDNLFDPKNGVWFQYYAGFYQDRLGSRYDFQSHTVDLRRYAEIAQHTVLALQLLAIERRGSVPFFELAPLGGNLRGIFAGRYMDRSAAMIQGELRYPIWKRFSGVVFVGAGDVAAGLDTYRIAHTKLAGGLGLRFLLNRSERLKIRFDIGASREGVETYFQFLEAF
ncbi:MAG: BamA/TamA family outer membrane protein [Candidatus Eisenbacteria bacterium]|nr:BamA/TamA family outer membrane protein [Candidatus Eisenbacteria bacterium]